MQDKSQTLGFSQHDAYDPPKWLFCEYFGIRSGVKDEAVDSTDYVAEMWRDHVIL